MPLELDLQVASAAPDLPSEAQFRAWCELACASVRSRS